MILLLRPRHQRVLAPRAAAEAVEVELQLELQGAAVPWAALAQRAAARLAARRPAAEAVLHSLLRL